MTPVGEKDWKLESGLSWCLPYVPLPFAHFNLYPLPITIGIKVFLSLASPGELSKLSVVLETPDIENLRRMFPRVK